MVVGGLRVLRALVALGAVVGAMLVLAGPAGAAGSPSVVVSQVFGGGGNTGAPYANDFIELFNRSSLPVSIAGWSVQYASATGTGNFSANTPTSLSGVLQPGQYYLVQQAGGATGAPLPVPDTSGTINMSATGGKVIVATTTTGLACNGGSTPCSAAQLAQIVDLVGYGTANFFEGAAAAPAPSNTTSASRLAGGCIDTDSNGADFTAVTPAPRNTLSPVHLCLTDDPPSVTSTSPASGATDVAVDANVSITFGEAVDVTGSWYSISCDGTGAHTATVTGGPTTFTLDPSANFANGENCTVTVVAANVSDQDTNDPPDTMASDYVFHFSIAATVLSPVVVSQVYGGGGNTSAPYQNDFIEVFNRSTSTVSLSGWSVQYASATGTTWQVTSLSGSLAPGQYYLVQEAAGAGTGVPLPTADASGTINMSATAGKVALLNSTTALSGSCPTGGTITDFVGFGSTATCFEGSGPAPAPSNTTAELRNGAGCTETNNNAGDFATGTPTPRNTASPFRDCSADTAPSVSSTNPANGASGVPVSSNVAITFSEPVNVTGSWYSISCGSTGAHTATASGGPTTFTLDPAVDFTQGETCTVTVFAANVTDQDTNDPPDTMAANYVFSFTVETPPTAIHAIQGATHISPLNGQAVRTTGIVIAKSTNGFWMQDPSPDADDATSEGIFVFTSSAPTVSLGDSVSVSANVQEFRPGGASTGNLTTTELSSPSISVISTGNPLPAPTVIGTGGRIPPDTIIEDDASSGNVETSGVFDPAQDGLDFYESLEGMRVQLNDAVAVGPTATSFGETPVVGDNGVNASVRTNRGGLLLRPNDGNPERITLDDLTPVGNANVGDHYYGAIVGVMDYNFGNPFLEVTSAPAVTHDGVQRETTDPAAAGELAVSTFNFENLAFTNPQSKFDSLASIIVNNLRSPDVLAGEEVQDNNGATDNGVVDASQTLQRLVDAIVAAGGPTYAWRQIDPVNDQDGGEPGGNIRQVIMFRTDRGISFVDRPGASSTTPNAVVGSGASTQLQFSPGRIAPADGAWSSSRKPLAAELTYQGHKLFVIVNHFNSKGGDDPLRGRFQPPVQVSATQRHQQATLVANFVSQIGSADPTANVIVLGDLNDFEFSETVQILKAAKLHDLMETLPLNQRYSYEFEGNAQVLDHMLVSDALFARPSLVFDPVHVNAEFFDQASDHDPSVMRVTFNGAPSVSAGGPYTVGEGSTTTLTATGSDPDGDTLTYAWDLDNNGSFETPGQSVSFSAPDGPATPTVRVQVTDPSGSTATDSTTVTVQNVAPTATFNAPATDFAGFPFTLSLSSPHDPSAADTAAGFEYAFDCGTGYGSFGSASSVSCPTDDTGTRTVHATIRDKDGGTTEYTATVEVKVTFTSLCNLTRQYSSKVALANRLCELLADAEADANNGVQPKPKNPPRKPANEYLNRYVKQVNSSVPTAFTSTEAATLTRLAQRLDDLYFAPPARPGSARPARRSQAPTSRTR